MKLNKSAEMYRASPFEAIHHFDLTYVKRMTLKEYEEEIDGEERDLLCDNEQEVKSDVLNKASNDKEFINTKGILSSSSSAINKTNASKRKARQDFKQYELRRQALSSRNTSVTFSSKYPSYDRLGRELCVLYQIQDHAVAEELRRVAGHKNQNTNGYNNQNNHTQIVLAKGNNVNDNCYKTRHSGVRLSSEILLAHSNELSDINTNTTETNNVITVTNEYVVENVKDTCKVAFAGDVACHDEVNGTHRAGGNALVSNKPVQIRRETKQPWRETELENSACTNTKRSLSSLRSSKSNLEFANNNSEFTIYRDSSATTNDVHETLPIIQPFVYSVENNNRASETSLLLEISSLPHSQAVRTHNNTSRKTKKISLPPPIINRNTSEVSITTTNSHHRARSMPLCSSDKENSDNYYPPPSLMSKKTRVEVDMGNANGHHFTNNVNTLFTDDEIHQNAIPNNVNCEYRHHVKRTQEEEQQCEEEEEQQEQFRQECKLHEPKGQLCVKQEEMGRTFGKLEQNTQLNLCVREGNTRLSMFNDPIRLTAFRESDVRITKQLFRNTATTVLTGQTNRFTIHTAANYTQPISSNIYGMHAGTISAHKVLSIIEDNYSNYFSHNSSHVELTAEPFPTLKCHSCVKLHDKVYKLTRFYASSEVYEALDVTELISSSALQEQQQEEQQQQQREEYEEQHCSKEEIIDECDKCNDSFIECKRNVCTEHRANNNNNNNNSGYNNIINNYDHNELYKICNRVLLYRWRSYHTSNKDNINSDSINVNSANFRFTNVMEESTIHEGWRASLGLGLCSHDAVCVESYRFTTGGITVISGSHLYPLYSCLPLSGLPLNGPSYCTALKMMLKVLSTMVARRLVHGSLTSLSDIFVALPKTTLTTSSSSLPLPENQVKVNQEQTKNEVEFTTIAFPALTSDNSNKHEQAQMQSIPCVSHLPQKEHCQQKGEKEQKIVNTTTTTTAIARSVNKDTLIESLPVIIPVHWERMVDFGMFIDRNVGRTIDYDSEDGSEQPSLTLGHDLASVMKCFLIHPASTELSSEQQTALQKLIMMTSEATQVANYLLQIQCVMRTLPTNLDALYDTIRIVEESSIE